MDFQCLVINKFSGFLVGTDLKCIIAHLDGDAMCGAATHSVTRFVTVLQAVQAR